MKQKIGEDRFDRKSCVIDEAIEKKCMDSVSQGKGLDDQCKARQGKARKDMGSNGRKIDREMTLNDDIESERKAYKDETRRKISLKV